MFLPAQCDHGCKHGECVGPNKCKCFPGYTGKTCSQGESSRSVERVWKIQVNPSTARSDFQPKIHHNRFFHFSNPMFWKKMWLQLLASRFERVRPETSTLWASLHEHVWKLQMLLSERLHLDVGRLLCRWGSPWNHVKQCVCSHCVNFLFVQIRADSRTCSVAHCQYGCEEVQGEIRCLCPSSGLQLGQDQRTCVGEPEHGVLYCII